MREADLKSRKRRRFRAVTAESNTRTRASGCPERSRSQFGCDDAEPGMPGLSTYVPTAEGWLYLAFLLNIFTRKMVGSKVSDSMPQDLTLQACKRSRSLGMA